MSDGAIWLIVGVQAAGKSTVAEMLAQTFERGVPVRGGQFYRWAVRGWVHPGTAGRERDARDLLDLRYRLSSLVADQYCAAGFTTVVQDNIFGDDVVSWLRRVRARPRHLVVLRPSLAVVAAREERRKAATGKIAYRDDGFTIEALDRALGEITPVGLWLDTSTQTRTDTLEEILRRRGEAEVDEFVDGT